MSIYHLQLVIIIVTPLILLVWIATDPRPTKERLSIDILKPYSLTSLFYLFQLLGWVFWRLPISNSSNLIVYLGLLIYLLGGFVAIWAKLTMSSTWGAPAQHDISRQRELITKGPFAFSRNPIYLGIILNLIGFSLVLQSSAIFLAIFLVIYFYSAVKKEEQLLEHYFGNRYREYKKSVPRFFIF